ncbi:hypothetical protein [Burkholderia ubonensis]|uniref:hypothetical protein n=1 Tax=Burkholderia ubonensis TaxID=101571 RepID=UPI00076C2AC4|nr:hypothetical protein [Burkholderia ubonensis]KVO11750.1 hypothetical protein WJ73_19585 [Burkholderia ubonensis]
MSTPDKPTSRLLRVLSDNLKDLIGPEGRFHSVRELGELPKRDPIGVKPIYRAMRAEQEPTLLQLERLAEATGVVAPLLICEGMEANALVSNSGIREEIRTLINKLIALDKLKPLTELEIQHVDNTLAILGRETPQQLKTKKVSLM